MAKNGKSTPIESFNYYLSAQELFQLELWTLKRLELLSWPGQLATWRNQIIAASRSAGSTGALNLHLRFKAQDPRAGMNAKEHWIELGSSVNTNANTLVTYLFAIGEEDGDSRCKGLRKIHFDLETKSSSAEPKPALHVQFAGGCPPILLSSGYGQDAFNHLLPGLDKPRIPSLPMCTVLLLQWAFLEYQSSDEGINKFIKTPEWQAVICAAERDILKKYFQNARDWLAATANEKKSFISYLYH